MDKVSGKVHLLMADDEFKASCAKEMALLALMERTGYNMVQENGQRKYGGPPPGECRTGGAQGPGSRAGSRTRTEPSPRPPPDHMVSDVSWSSSVRVADGKCLA